MYVALVIFSAFTSGMLFTLGLVDYAMRINSPRPAFALATMMALLCWAFAAWKL